MFFSNDILRQRKHGIATIWLMATLGHKPSNKKISKKTIQAVNIPKACHTVTEPVAPLALRLQGNLLFGISRVFLSQCNYVLSDAESAQQAIRLMSRILRDSQLDPEAGKAKREHLVIPDDPTFVPDLFPSLELDPDFTNLDFSSLGSSQTSRSDLERINGSSTSMSLAAGFEAVASSIGPNTNTPDRARYPTNTEHALVLGLDDDQGFVFDPGFEIDEEGNLVDVTGEDIVQPVQGLSEVAAQPNVNFDPHGSINATELAGLGSFEYTHEDIPLPQIPIDMYHMPLQPENPRGAVASSQNRQPREVAAQSQEETRDESNFLINAAPQTLPHRQRRTIPTDRHTELSSSELQRWQDNYIKNMRQAKRDKRTKSLPTRARKFAYRCVWGRGLGGVGSQDLIMQQNGPFAHLSGQGLHEMLLGGQEHSAGKKRSSSPTSEEEERRVRRRSDDMEQGHGILVDDPGGVINQQEIEIGRTAPEALDDISSQMPWNIASSTVKGSRANSLRSGSRTRSIAPRHRNRTALFSAGIPSSGPSTDPLERIPQHRAPSESPLRGRGRASFFSSEEDLSVMQGSLGFEDTALKDFELDDPGILAGMQLDDSTLHSMDGNFLNFVRAESEKQGRTMITFEQLLPLQDNNHVVATHGFFHVLNLATKGLLSVEQDQHFDAPLKISVLAQE